MDKRLLFSAALVAAISANEAKAQEKVTEPAFPSPVQLKLDGTDTVAIKNVKADKWLVNGLSYETQASLSTDNTMGVAIVPVEGKPGVYNLLNNNAKKGTYFKNKIFYNDNSTAYVDYASQGEEKTYWEIHDVGNGQFQLQADTTSTANKKNTAGTRAGYDPSDEETNGYVPFRPVLKPGAADYGLDFVAYPYEYFYRKDVLMSAINTAIDDHSDCDFSEVVKIYNDENAKLWQLKRAYDMINEIIRNKTIEGATADSPISLTEYMTNANCDALAGWDYNCVYDKDGNVNSGGHGTNWQTHKAEWTATDGFKTSQFIERWIASDSNPDTNNEAGTGHLSDGTLSQTLRNLPAGGYRVSCYAMACQQGKGAGFKVDGVSLYAKTSGGTEKAAAVSTDPNVPQKFTFLIGVDKGEDLTLGFKLDNATANWVFVDEFQVEYCGSDAKLMSLVDMQEVATAMQNDLGGLAACPDYISAADALCNSALGMTTAASDAEIADMKKQLQDVQAKIDTNVQKYIDFEKFVTEIDEFMGEGGDTEEVTALQELYDNCGIDGVEEGAQDLISSYTLNNEQLDQYTAQLKEKLAAARKSVIAPGSDVTWKFVNPSFTDNANGWTSTNSPVTNTTYQNTEKYQGTFDMHQDITNLPNGVYEVSVQAMHRVANNVDAAPKYESNSEDITAYLYANDLSAKFASPYSAKMDVASGGSPADYEYNGGFIPNSMQGFQAACDANADNYKVTLNVLVTDGNLRVGVKEDRRPNPEGGDWAIWDNFKMTYVGNDQAAIDMVSGPVIEQAEALYDSKMSADVLAALKTAVANVQTAGKAETISALSAAIKDAQASIEVYKTLNSAIANAESRYETNESSYKTSDDAKAIYDNALATAKSVYDNGSAADDDVPAAIKALNTGFTQYVIHDNEAKATLENPVDISNVIVNNDFATMDATGWTSKVGAPGFQANNAVEAAEFYNKAFDFRQEIVGLPAGTYYLQTRAFYRNGSNPAAVVDAEAEEPVLKYNVNDNAFIYFSNKAEKADETATQAGATATEELPAIKQALKTITAYVIDDSEREELGMSSTDGLTEFGSTDDSKKYVVNDMIRAQMIFNAEKSGASFDSEPLKFIYDGKSDFRIGFIKTALEANDWTIIKNITLKYAGKEEYVNGINEVATDADVVATKIYTVGGAQVSKLQKGINIIETTKKDGTKTVKKVVVK